jgi:serine/threonine protein kinase
MNYLHRRSPPLVHRDLKSPNLLVDKKYTVKVWFMNCIPCYIWANNFICMVSAVFCDGAWFDGHSYLLEYSLTYC